jgi:superfamily I DNA/RNA helicase
LDGKIDTKRITRPPQPKTNLLLSKDFKNEVSFIKGYLQDLIKKGIPLADVCLVAQTQRLLGQYSQLLGEAGIEIYPVRREAADDRSKSGLRLATMHRVKGLEFDRVIIASANADVLPLKASAIDTEDPHEVIENKSRERALLYVAIIRARREAVICSWGKPSPYIASSM